MALHWPKTPRQGHKGGSPFLAGLLILATLATSASPPEANRTSSEPLAPGYRPLDYPVADPGSFTLSDLGPAADALLLESTGSKISLHALMRDKITVISFIYASCGEVNGCPLATSVLHRTLAALKAYPETLAKVRLLTISFDPSHDTPKVMARYARPFTKEKPDWHFLTAPSAKSVKDLLAAYQQSITPEVNAQGKATGSISHVLKVILVDDQLRIRNIYSPSVLHPDLLAADIRTLILANSAQPGNPSVITPNPSPPKLRPGDDKSQYERSDYRTQSAALTQRTGAAQDLIGLGRQSSLGLPKDPYEEESPLTQAKVTLGRKLFYDRRLSLNGTFSCAMCHIPEQGFTSQEQSTAIGIEGRTVRRNAPSLLNTGRLRRFFHDGREDRLENQVWGPFLAPNEMGNPAVGQVIEKIKKASDYQDLFEIAFGRGPSMDTIGEALAQYERTLTAGNSPFDQWYFGGQKTALSEDAQKGFVLFTGKARCSQCHSIDKSEALLTDQAFHNTGIGYRDSMGGEEKRTRVQLAPGVWTELDQTTIASVSEKKPADLGRYEITQNPEDRWKYRTPGLRNVALTAPYMHNGSLKTLEEVIQFYARGGIPNPGLDPSLKPISLSPFEVHSLAAFLKSLTSTGVTPLVEDAWAAPIGDPTAVSPSDARQKKSVSAE
jgi:cytochrome c peroxidase